MDKNDGSRTQNADETAAAELAWAHAEIARLTKERDHLAQALADMTDGMQRQKEAFDCAIKERDGARAEALIADDAGRSTMSALTQQIEATKKARNERDEALTALNKQPILRGHPDCWPESGAAGPYFRHRLYKRIVLAPGLTYPAWHWLNDDGSLTHLDSAHPTEHALSSAKAIQNERTNSDEPINQESNTTGQSIRSTG